MSRLVGLDFLRGLAVLGMVVFHFLFILYFFGLVVIDFSVWWMVVFARVVQFTFLGLVGVGMALSWRRREGFYGRQLSRVLKLGGLALVVSLATYLVIDEYFVRFGILHLIAVSSFILMWLVRWRFVVFVVGVLSLVLPFSWLNGASVDYFPLFPWLAVPAFGFVLADFVVKVFGGLRGVGWVNWCGSYSLWIYMVHVPVIWLGLVLVGVV